MELENYCKTNVCRLDSLNAGVECKKIHKNLDVKFILHSHRMLCGNKSKMLM